MKHLKWLLFLPIVAFPCFLNYLLAFSEFDQTAVLCALAVALAAALTVFFTRNHWTVKELSVVTLISKLLHTFFTIYPFIAVGFVSILAYWTSLVEPSKERDGILALYCIMLFLLLLFLLLYTLLSGLPSSLAGLAAVLRCRKEGRLTSKRAAIYGVLQFVFLADVVCAILLCRAAFKKEGS